MHRNGAHGDTEKEGSSRTVSWATYDRLIVSRLMKKRTRVVPGDQQRWRICFSVSMSEDPSTTMSVHGTWYSQTWKLELGWEAS